MAKKRITKKAAPKKTAQPLDKRAAEVFSNFKFNFDYKKIPALQKLSPQVLGLLAAVLVGALTLLFFGNQLVRAWQERTAAAVVNGETVPRDLLVRRMMQSYGEDTVERLVGEVLVLQEGRKNNITVTRAEIDEQIADIEKQIAPEKLEDALTQRRLTRADLEQQIIIQLTAEKILGKDIQISDQQIEEYFRENGSVLAEAKGKTAAELTLDEVRDEIREQIFVREVSSRYNSWLEELRNNSQIQTFVTP
jgi:hypothetical protein